jgi:YfiH family protein
MDDARIARWESITGLVHGFGLRDVDTARRLASCGRLYLLKQVHGATFATPPWETMPEADASVTAAPGQILGIKTADCLPVLFVDPARRIAAAAHAGWRGTAAGVVYRVLDWLAAQGSERHDLEVALGPCIGACCYEVGDDLRGHFAPDEQRFFVPGRGDRPHLDVRGINEAQLVAAGVARTNIAHVDECTYCLPERYYSYRREGAAAGRMINYVGWTS